MQQIRAFRVLAALLILLVAGCRPVPLRPGLTASPPTAPSASQVMEMYGQLPLAFEPNAGQTAANVDFLARGPGYTVFLTPTAAVLALRGPGDVGSALRLEMLGATLALPPGGQAPLSGTASYFRGADPTGWQAGLPTYGRVVYPAVWPGIDVVYYGRAGQLEYDFVVAPGASPEQARLRVDGASGLELDPDGALLLHTAAGTMRQPVPVIYQDGPEGDNRREPVSGGYLLDGTEVHFWVGPYDPMRPLVIDPTVIYSTFLGGSGNDLGNGIVVDASGQAYIVGSTLSEDFPTTAGAFATSANGAGDVLIAKLNAAGSALVYSTYLGGSALDQGSGIAVNASGQVYVVGSTRSGDFPTSIGAYDTDLAASIINGGDAFVTKLNAAGTSLLYSTYLGGSGDDIGLGIALDSSGNAYVTGSTTSPDLPSFTGSFAGGSDAFAAKLNAAGNALIYGRYAGGNDEDVGSGIAVNASGEAYITGYTRSTNLSTTVAGFSGAPGGAKDAFAIKFSSAGVPLLGTYLGGSGDDDGLGIALDGSGNVYVTGSTASANFPTTPGAFDTTLGGTTDAFVTKLSLGNPLVYSTYLGGSDYDAVAGIVVDGSGQVYAIGTTASPDFPTTPGAFDTTRNGGADAFVTKLNAAGTAAVYSTYLGGSIVNFGAGVAVDGSGQVYAIGTTASPDFPTTPGAFSTIINGTGGVSNGDVFVTKLDLRAPVAVTTVGSLGYTENDSPVAIDPGLSVGDPDSANLTGATVQITGGFQTGQDTLAFANQLGISGSYTPATGLLTLTGTTTVASYQTALRSVTYANNSDTPSATAHIITFQVTDETARTSGLVTRGVAVTAVNDPPTNAVPGAQSTSGNTPKVFSAANGNAIRVADVDAGSSGVRTTVAVTNGTLTVGAAGTVPPLTSVTGTGTASVVLVGTPASITAALDGLTFAPSSGFGGAATLTVTTDDLGNTGSGGPRQDQDSVQIAVVTGCNPRPGVSQTLAPGGGALNVTISPTPQNGGSANPIQRIVFGTFQNATVTLNGAAVSSGQTVTLSSGATSAGLVVRRAVAGQATTVPITVVDSCGEWKTFVGGGIAAGF